MHAVFGLNIDKQMLIGRMRFTRSYAVKMALEGNDAVLRNQRQQPPLRQVCE